MFVDPEHAGEAVHDDVGGAVVVDPCYVSEGDDGLHLVVRDRVWAGGWFGGIRDDDVEGDFEVGRVIDDVRVHCCLPEEGCQGVWDCVPFAVLRLVCYCHVPVAHCSLFFDQVLEVWEIGQGVLCCLDVCWVKVRGDVEVLVGVGCECAGVVGWDSVTFQSDGPAG